MEKQELLEFIKSRIDSLEKQSSFLQDADLDVRSFIDGRIVELESLYFDLSLLE